MKKIATLVLASSVLTTTAFAQNELAARPGAYAGINVGSGRIGSGSPNAIDDRSNVSVGGLIGYQYNKNLAAEVQLTTLGKAKDVAGGSVKGTALSVTAVGSIPFNNGFSVFGKAGVAESSTSVSGGFAGDDERRFAPTVGVGAQYAFAQSNLAVRVGWDRYGIATRDTLGAKQNSHANVVSAGLTYKF